MRFRSGLLQFCLAFALLLAQQGAYWHALTHLVPETARQEQDLPDSKSCPLDGVYAKVGSGLAAVPLAVAPACGADAVVSVPESFTFVLALVPGARAPPTFL